MQCSACQSANVDGAHFCATCGALLPSVEAAAAQDPLIGQTVGGRYTLRRVLGEGGMGRVYEADRQIAGITQRVAVKTLHHHLSQDAQIVARFHRECGTVAQLRHPNTIKVEDFGQTAQGDLYIAMEFVDGTSIGTELEQRGPMSPERVERILGQVCGSLAEAHKQGVIHRDLKPDNIVLMNVGDEVDFVKVLDFGIAARKDSTDAAKEAKLTQQGMVLGTPPYMSPEQFTGKALDARSDVYSLATMAYEMLTGSLPLAATTAWEWATQHMTVAPRPFEDFPVAAQIPSKMKAAILKAIAKKTDDRQANVREFFEDFSTGFSRLQTASAAIEAGQPQGGAATEAAALFSSPAISPAAAPAAHRTELAPAPAFVSEPMVVPYAGPVPAAPSYESAPRTSSRRGLLLGGVALTGIGLLVVGGVWWAQSRGNHDEHVALAMPSATASGGSIAQVVPLAASSLGTEGSAAALPIVVSPPPPPGGGNKTTALATSALPSAAKPTVTGDEACIEARNAGATVVQIERAIALYRNCSGPNQVQASRTIAANVPAAVDNSVKRNDCAGARRIARAGAAVGASFDVDSKFPQCKGK